MVVGEDRWAIAESRCGSPEATVQESESHREQCSWKLEVSQHVENIVDTYYTQPSKDCHRPGAGRRGDSR
jgi:hypothetical protein